MLGKICNTIGMTCGNMTIKDLQKDWMVNDVQNHCFFNDKCHCVSICYEWGEEVLSVAPYTSHSLASTSQPPRQPYETLTRCDTLVYPLTKFNFSLT